MNQNWSVSFPDKFDLSGSSLHKLPFIKNFDQFVTLANKFRNIFRNNFIYNESLSYDESYSFLKNLNKDHSRVWYAESFEGEWIGHFGVKSIGKKNILLDNALRFSPKGGKSFLGGICQAKK